MSGTYAPELNVVGAVLGSPVGDLGHTFRRLNGTFMSGLPALVVAALAHIYPELDRVIQRARHRRGQDAAGTAAHDDDRRGGHPDGQEGHGRHGRRAAGADPRTPLRFSTSSTTSSSGAAAPTPPVLIVQAVHDQLISVARHRRAGRHLPVGRRIDVTYHRDMFSEHMLLHPLSAPMTLRWLTRPIQRQAAVRAHDSDQMADAAEPMTYVGMARLAKIVAKVVTGRTVERSPL